MDVIHQHQQSSQRSSLQDKTESRSNSRHNLSEDKPVEVIGSNGSSKGRKKVTEGQSDRPNSGLSSDNPISPSTVQPISSIGNIRIASNTVLQHLKIENESLQNSSKKLSNQQLQQKDQELWIKEEQTRIKLEQLKRELKKQEESENFLHRIQSRKSVQSRRTSELQSNDVIKVENLDDTYENVLEDSGTLKRSDYDVAPVNGRGDSDINAMNVSSSSDSDVLDVLHKPKQQPPEEVGQKTVF